MKPKTAVHLIRAFAGPLHERLELIWRHFADQNRDTARVVIHENIGTGIDHPQMLNHIWRDLQSDPEEFVIFSELDFLPHPHHFFRPLRELEAGFDACSAEFVTRDPDTWRLRPSGTSGPWYMAMKKSACPRDLNFVGAPDTANQIADQVRKNGRFRLLPHTDAYPDHWGVNMEPGTHLFFSRHYNDPPETRVAGFPLGSILTKVEKKIRQYLELIRGGE